MQRVKRSGKIFRQGTSSPLFFWTKLKFYMYNSGEIKALIDGNLHNSEIFWVDVHVNPENHIIVVLDGDKGVKIDDCKKISRLIEGTLDREIEDYDLEVTSFGIGKPLKMLRQYLANLGRKAEVILADGMKYTGRLQSANETEIVLNNENKKKKKKNENTIQTIKFQDIKTTKIIPDFGGSK